MMPVNGELTADQIIGRGKVRVKKVETPEWGGHVYVRVLGGKDRDFWDRSLVRVARAPKTGEVLQVQENLTNVRARLVVLACCDSEGNRLWPDMAAVDEVGEQDGLVLDRIFDAAQELNGLGDHAVTDAVGNSGGNQLANSGSS